MSENGVNAPVRIGHGYDVHKFAAGRLLILGGVQIPHTHGLAGHSDADVLLHAVMDAVLGALGLGDIGRHFPDSDPALLGADSLLLTKQVAILMRENGYRIGNIDATLIAQSPRLAPYISEMKENIAAAFSCASEQVNVKATTEEGLGFTGRKEGIAAHAVCICFKN